MPTSDSSELPAATSSSTLYYSIAAYLLTFFALNQSSVAVGENEQQKVYNWLNELGLGDYGSDIYKSGCVTLVHCAKIWSIDPAASAPGSGLPWSVRTVLVEAAWHLRRRLILRQWLREHQLRKLQERFHSHGVNSLEDVLQLYQTDNSNFKSLFDADSWHLLSKALNKLPSSENELMHVTEKLWDIVVKGDQSSQWGFGATLVVALLVALLVSIATTMFQHHLVLDGSTASKLGFLAYVTGKYLAPQNCKIEFDWTDPYEVGSTMRFIIKFFQRNGQAYPICDEDGLLVEITQGNQKVASSVVLGGTNPDDANKAHVRFRVCSSGEYHISVLIGMVHIRGSPFIKHFLPGTPDPLKTGFIHHCSTVVCAEGTEHHLLLEPRDSYNNLCTVNQNIDLNDDYNVNITEATSDQPVHILYYWERYSGTSRIALVWKIMDEGCYRAIVSYRGVNIKNGEFHIIVLNGEKVSVVEKNIAKKHNIWYEARLISLKGEKFQKPKKVYCYISPKQLTIKESMLKFFTTRLTTFRLCPSTKFQFKSSSNHQGQQVLVIDDGCQPAVELISQDRKEIVATFIHFLLKNIGGSETFKDKQDFFYHEVRKYHQKHFHDKLQLKVHREKLLESSMKVTQGFGVTEWCKNFEIMFVGEQGLDWGGVRRELFELICSALFSPENQLFCSFKNDKQGLVHPNPKRPAYLSPKYYEFAGKIVGKCLYESALGSTYRQLVKARFSRSFLAQLIGLRVHYKYFEQDDPDLYMTKIKYILEKDVDGIELYFVEEEMISSGQIKEVELIPGGSQILVTNQNKLQYLDALAQYRLAKSIKTEVEYFLKGLNDLIPDNLLFIFDENELELLMCGTGHYSIADFKANHAVSGSSYEFRKVLDWFWTAVSNFSEEEMARLLQFTTGCSQLPPGGFAELNPKFHITAAPTFGNLPTAHTCFNQLCLPDYHSYEQFEKALRLAINEGSEGFGII